MDRACGNAEILARMRGRLDARPPELAGEGRKAAVLMPLVEEAGGLSVLLTLRRDDLPAHAGQISFPGGRMEDGESVLEAALRETREETGIAPDYVEPLGYWDACDTSTGYQVAPVAGLLRPGFALAPCPREVAEIFTIPLAFLLDPANHRREEIFWRGRMRRYWVMRHGDRMVWGATAAMLRRLWERLENG